MTVTPSIVLSVAGLSACRLVTAASAAVTVGKSSRASIVTEPELTVSSTPIAVGWAARMAASIALMLKLSTVAATVKVCVTTAR